MNVKAVAAAAVAAAKHKTLFIYSMGREKSSENFL
jgi:hypothetical protein